MNTATSSTFNHNLPRDIKILNGRHPFIVDYCAGKKVLHIGCVDSGIMAQRHKAGELLHQKLDSIAEELCGIDIDQDGISFLTDKGFKNLFVADITDSLSLERLRDKSFDVIILSEVIEHLPNIGLALQALKAIAIPGHTDFIISAPNAFSASILEALLQNVETVHPDHNCYFSHVTLSNTIAKSGYEITQRYLYSFQGKDVIPSRFIYQSSPHEPKPANATIKQLYWSFRKSIGSGSLLKGYLRRAVLKYMFSRSPFWSEGLMYICRVPKTNGNPIT